MFILSTHQDLMNVCFMKSLYKIIKSLLVLYTALQTNVIFIFFASYYTQSDNNSKISKNQTYITNSKLSSPQLDGSNIIKIIRLLDASKASGHDDISIKMIKYVT